MEQAAQQPAGKAEVKNAPRKKEKAEVSEIQLKHNTLKHDLETKKGIQQYWAELLADEPMTALVAEYEAEIQRCRVSLETAKSEEVKTLQAGIAARRSILSALRSRADISPVQEAARVLRRFEADNALLLEGATSGE